MGVQINGDTGNISATKADYSGNVTIGGTLTYEDVTNIDSVGLVTARSGIEVGARPGVAASISVDGNMIVSGIATFSSDTSISIADKIVHTGDTNTAIRFPTADIVSFETGGSERMRLDDTGQLLLGHTGSNEKVAGLLAQVNIETTAAANLTIKRNSNNEFDPVLALGKTRSSSTGGSTIVQENDRLGTIAFYGSDGNDTGSDAAIIRAECDGTPGSDDMPGRLLFMTTADGANGASERLRITKDGRLFQGSSTGRNSAINAGVSQYQLEGTSSGSSTIGIFCNNTGTAAGVLIFGKSKGSSLGSTTVVQNNDSLGHISFEGTDGSQNRTAARITASVDGAVSGGGAGDMPGRLSFFTTQDGSGSETERLRIQQNGNVMLGDTAGFTSNTAKFDIFFAGGASGQPTYVTRFFQNTDSQNTDHACLQLRHAAATGSQTAVMIDFKNASGSSHGSIKMAASSVSFNTTSDYRLKENEVTISDAISKVKQLKPYTFNFKADSNTTIDGFFAHEAQEVVPYAVTGEKDAEEMQSMDYGKLTPLLTAALQKAISEIEILKAEVAALKSN